MELVLLRLFVSCRTIAALSLLAVVLLSLVHLRGLGLGEGAGAHLR